MKKSFIALFLLLGASALPAATLLHDNSFGLRTSGGSALSSGVVRYGYFVSAPSGAETVTDLNNAFTEIASYNITTSTWSGATNSYANNTSYLSGAGASRNYDDTPLNNADVGTDIASSPIYAWVLNNATIGSATEQGIFSAAAFGFTWTDAQQPGSTDSVFSFDLGSADGMVAHIGTAVLDPSLGGHQLASVGVIPEPSKAIFGFMGLSAMLFRRRRAAK
ncbi:MAG: hypothetical protein HS117_25610 [Verrucomicrobiaceae bacterium]|jgi:hypothetical protein|nr:hypothetical protein [Verrucomicrobiaceae bacterium]